MIKYKPIINMRHKDNQMQENQTILRAVQTLLWISNIEDTFK